MLAVATVIPTGNASDASLDSEIAAVAPIFTLVITPAAIALAVTASTPISFDVIPDVATLI